METGLFHGMLIPDECALALIDFQLAMFAGVHSHDRTAIVQNVQIVAKARYSSGCRPYCRRLPRRVSADQ